MENREIKPNTLIFANRFREMLSDIGMKHKEFAQLVMYSTPWISNMMTGKKQITEQHAILFCEKVNKLNKTIDIKDEFGKTYTIPYKINPDWLTDEKANKFLYANNLKLDQAITTMYSRTLEEYYLPQYLTIEYSDKTNVRLTNTLTGKICYASIESVFKMCMRINKIENDLWNTFFSLYDPNDYGALEFDPAMLCRFENELAKQTKSEDSLS